MTRLPLGFIPEPMTIPLDMILPSRKMPEAVISSRKYKQIQSSIKAIGLIEPLIVGNADKITQQHVLLDGHIRLFALRQLGFVDAPCLTATDDETYTYNNRINRLSTIQEHLMIRRAIERGVTPHRLAEALNVEISHIINKKNLLDGICGEAAELLKDQHFSANIVPVLRKLKPMRQVECVELMLTSNMFTISYTKALLAATPSNMLVGEKKPRTVSGATPELMAKMEREMGSLQGQFKLVEQSYSQDVLNLVLAKGYLVKLLGNEAVTRFLMRHQPDVLVEFESIIQTVSLNK